MLYDFKDDIIQDLQNIIKNVLDEHYPISVALRATTTKIRKRSRLLKLLMYLREVGHLYKSIKKNLLEVTLTIARKSTKEEL